MYEQLYNTYVSLFLSKFATELTNIILLNTHRSYPLWLWLIKERTGREDGVGVFIGLGVD